MKRIDVSRLHSLKFIAVPILCALMWSAVSVQAWEVGYMGTVIKGRSSGGTGLSYGGDLMVQEDLCPYFDAGMRVGYTKSDCFKVKYVPLQATLSVKYPLDDGKWVPYAGIGIGYHFFLGGNIDLRDTVGYYPRLGVNYRLGEKKQWSIFIEATYRFLEADVTGGSTTETKAKLDGGGGSFGFSYRF